MKVLEERLTVQGGPYLGQTKKRTAFSKGVTLVAVVVWEAVTS